MACKGHPDEFEIDADDSLVSYACTEKKAREALESLILDTAWINADASCEDFDCPRDHSCNLEVTNTKELKNAMVCNLVRHRSCPGKKAWKCYLPKDSKIKSDCDCVREWWFSATYNYKDYLIEKFAKKSKCC